MKSIEEIKKNLIEYEENLKFQTIIYDKIIECLEKMVGDKS